MRSCLSPSSEKNGYNYWKPTTREEENGEGKLRESFCPLSWTVHHNFSEVDYSEYATVVVSKQDF